MALLDLFKQVNQTNSSTRSVLVWHLPDKIVPGRMAVKNQETINYRTFKPERVTVCSVKFLARSKGLRMPMR